MSRIILIPGNGNDSVETSMWYPSVIHALAEAKDPKTSQALFGGGTVLTTFPDPYDAHENIWIRFMEDDIEINESDVVIGHSSGAAAILRYIETRKVKGVILVSAYHSDLGDISEVKTKKKKYTKGNVIPGPILPYVVCLFLCSDH